MSVPAYLVIFQLFIVQQYLFCRAYRAFYILNWVYRYFTEGHQNRWIRELKYIIFAFVSSPIFYDKNCFLTFSVSFSLECWSGPNWSICRFLLLLFLKVNCIPCCKTCFIHMLLGYWKNRVDCCSWKNIVKLELPA